MFARTSFLRPQSNVSILGLLTLSLLLASPHKASAQYMYLDSNGDGINTADDRLNAVGPTHVTVWLDIAHDRDGTPVTCNSHTGPPLAEPLDMFLHCFLLEVVDRTAGSVIWGAFADSVGFDSELANQSEPFYLSICRTGPIDLTLPAGKYKLGTLDVTVASGAPSIRISPNVEGASSFIYNNFTGFGGHCDASLNPNFYTLGVDWFDTDGLRAASSTETSYAARVYSTNSGDTFRIHSGKPGLCVQVEPVGAAYVNSSVNLNTLVMLSPGTGTVSQILASPDKTSVGGDRDGNGVQEITACFARTDLERLFSNVTGRQDVTVTVEAALSSGGSLHGTASITVIGDRTTLAASVSPNPLNPEATLRFVTDAPGSLRVRIFDVRGRMIREVVNQSLAPAGDHSVRIDGSGMPSGIYLYRIDSSTRTVTGRFAILK